ncbi:MAG: hypothetical protein J6Q22_10205 [Prevotella sp.]|nr:hypothetical protein [Prevotella sp.]
MDIVYVVGKGSKHDNLELRMSLRSIAKFGKNVGNVIVVGMSPKWLSDNIIKVEVEDKYVYKHSNILMCIEKVVELGLVQGDFLYSSDDHFYCKHVDFNQYPYFLKGELRDKVFNCDPYYRYHKSLVDTRELCNKYGFQTRDYSQHCNTHMNAEVIAEIKPVIQESYRLPFGVEPTSLIMNAWQTRHNAPEVIKREDVKILYAENLADLWRRIGDRDCFSIGDSLFNGSAIRNFFKQTYSNKSPFEAD